jgi:hypothetical protein
MDFKTETLPTPKYTDLQSSRMMDCLDTLVAEATSNKCADCNRLLSFDHADIYDHEYGWGLIAEIPKQWISFKCSCGYETSLTKLGVSR